MTDRAFMQAKCQQKAADMWAAFDKNQKTGVRFGMFPAKPMQDAAAEGYDGKELAVALMNQASANGGMRA